MLVRDENSDSGDFDAVEDAVETVGDDGSEQQDMEIDPMLHAVQQWNTRSRRKNTAKAYDPKALEFEEYCCHCYPHEACPTLMTSGKVFFFMLYQFMRAKRPGGSKKRDDSGEYQHFRMAEFMEVSEACQNYVAELRSWTENNRRGEEPIPPEATNPSGHSTYTQYKSALKSLYMAQTARGWEVLAWEQVWSPFTTNLEKLARLRKDRVDRSQFKEKNGSASLMQYHMVQWIPKIEEAMWNKITNFRSALQWMRNRFFFLFTKCAVLRGQTLFNMEISDLAIVSNQNENDLHVMSVLVAQFTTGKTKKDNKASFGRAARHHDVRACPVGGLAFFLALRFFVSREFDHPEFDPRWFVGNENWFRIKLLADPYEFGRGEMATKNIDYSTYYKPVQQVLLDLNMPSNVIAHLGRHLGHRTLEMKEAQDADIDKLGNWNQEKPRSRHYSTNLPITPLRQMAMESQRSKYYVPRTVVMDELEPLLAKTPFSFVYAALQYETELMAENKSTAYLVIRCMAELNIVFLQDAAAMWVKYPERRNHPIYTLPVFREPAWDNYVKLMEQRLEIMEKESPLNATVEQVLPGVLMEFTALRSEVSTMNDNVKKGFERVEAKIDCEIGGLKMLTLQLGRAFLAYARSGQSTSIDSKSFADLDGVMAAATIPTAPVTPVRNVAAHNSDAPPQFHRLCPLHKSLASLWNEWHGNDEFEGIPVVGGLKHLEESMGHQWRAHFSQSEKTAFSRMKSIVLGIDNYAVSRQISSATAVDELDETFREFKCQLAKMVSWLQDRDYIQKKQARGKHATSSH